MKIHRRNRIVQFVALTVIGLPFAIIGCSPDPPPANTTATPETVEPNAAADTAIDAKESPDSPTPTNSKYAWERHIPLGASYARIERPVPQAVGGGFTFPRRRISVQIANQARTLDMRFTMATSHRYDLGEKQGYHPAIAYCDLNWSLEPLNLNSLFGSRAAGVPYSLTRIPQQQISSDELMPEVVRQVTQHVMQSLHKDAQDLELSVLDGPLVSCEATFSTAGYPARLRVYLADSRCFILETFDSDVFSHAEGTRFLESFELARPENLQPITAYEMAQEPIITSMDGRYIKVTGTIGDVTIEHEELGPVAELTLDAPGLSGPTGDFRLRDPAVAIGLYRGQSVTLVGRDFARGIFGKISDCEIVEQGPAIPDSEPIYSELPTFEQQLDQKATTLKLNEIDGCELLDYQPLRLSIRTQAPLAGPSFNVQNEDGTLLGPIAKILQQPHFVKELELDRLVITQALIDQIATFTGIEQIRLDCGIVEEAQDFTKLDLSSLAEMETLTGIELRGPFNPDDATLEQLGQCRSLRSVTITTIDSEQATPFTRVGIDALAALPHLHQLELEYINPLLKPTNSKSGKHTTDADFSGLHNHPTLKTVDLSYPQLTRKILETLVTCPQLVAVELDSDSLNKPTEIAIKPEDWKFLSRFSLNTPDVNDSTATELINLLPDSIESISFGVFDPRENGLTVKTLQAILDRHFAKLDSLTLTCVRLNDTEADLLLKFPQLTFLLLPNTISDAKEEQLKDVVKAQMKQQLDQIKRANRFRGGR